MKSFVTFMAAFVLLAGLMSVVLMPEAEPATRVCGERAKMLAFLKVRYGETIRAIGVYTSGKSVMELLSSDKGTWTVLLTSARGRTCIMGAGHSFQLKALKGEPT